MINATRTRPHVPGDYGLSPDDSNLLDWSWVVERLTTARSYWICSTYPDGRPHASPVWGGYAVQDDRMVFAISEASRKGRNLTADPRVTVHLESGDEVVIIEGHVERVTDDAMLARVVEAYGDKYGDSFQPTVEELRDNLVYAVVPRVVLAWLEADYPNTATRWVFTNEA